MKVRWWQKLVLYKHIIVIISFFVVDVVIFVNQPFICRWTCPYMATVQTVCPAHFTTPLCWFRSWGKKRLKNPYLFVATAAFHEGFTKTFKHHFSWKPEFPFFVVIIPEFCKRFIIICDTWACSTSSRLEASWPAACANMCIEWAFSY